MQKGLLIALATHFLLFPNLKGQSSERVTESFHDIDSLTQVPDFRAAHPDWTIQPLRYQDPDTFALNAVLDLELGAISQVRYKDSSFVLKSIIASTHRQHRVSYVYLDAKQLFGRRDPLFADHRHRQLYGRGTF